MKYLFVLIVGIVLSTDFCQAAETVAVLKQQAQHRRAQAELSLVELRKLILKQRQALLADLLKEQEKLQFIRKQADETQRRSEALAALEEQRGEQARTQDSHMRMRIERASAALHMPSPETGDIKAVRVYLQSGIQELLNRLDKNAIVSVEEASCAGRDGMPIQARIIRLGAVQNIAWSKDSNNSGLLLSSGEGHIINGPLLSELDHAELAVLMAGKQASVVADLDGSLVKQQFVEATWSDWFRKGGFFVWPICLVGLVAACLACERIIYLVRLRMSPVLSVSVIEAIQNQQIEQAQAMVVMRKTPLQRILDIGIKTIHRHQEEREAALDAALLEEESALERSRSLLAVLAAVAPLLGLLGTVTGMISTFQSIALYGTANPALLSNGISEALITTQLGLVVAVPILLVHGVINRLAEKRRIILEQSAGQIMTCSGAQ